jgi:hypothetical protein
VIRLIDKKKQRTTNNMSYHPYDSCARLAPQTTARIAREVRDLIVSPESGVHLIVDEATGLPHSLQELTVRFFSIIFLPLSTTKGSYYHRCHRRVEKFFF